MKENITETIKDKIDCLAKSYEYGQIDLNEWERNFLNSIEQQLSEKKDLSINQLNCLNKIYGKL